jgi:hypothetical protein
VLEIAFNNSLLQVFPFNFLDFFSLGKKSTKLVFLYRLMGSNNFAIYDSSVTGALPPAFLLHTILLLKG